MNSVGESCQLVIAIHGKVTVWYFVIDTHKVLTALCTHSCHVSLVSTPGTITTVAVKEPSWSFLCNLIYRDIHISCNNCILCGAEDCKHSAVIPYCWKGVLILVIERVLKSLWCGMTGMYGTQRWSGELWKACIGWCKVYALCLYISGLKSQIFLLFYSFAIRVNKKIVQPQLDAYCRDCTCRWILECMSGQ